MVEVYICEDCNAVFTSPNVRTVIIDDEFGGHRETEESCPVCGSDYIRWADYCPICGRAKLHGDRLCAKCKKELSDSFSKYVTGLSKVELMELDDMLDGESVTEFVEEK